MRACLPVCLLPTTSPVHPPCGSAHQTRLGKDLRGASDPPVEFAITSLLRKQVAPEQLLQIRRAHWGSEAGLHYRRDVTFKENAARRKHRQSHGFNQRSGSGSHHTSRFAQCRPSSSLVAVHLYKTCAILTSHFPGFCESHKKGNGHYFNFCYLTL